MRIPTTLAALALFTLAAGCAGKGEPAPSDTHPASPMAAETPAPKASTTLKGGTLKGGTPAPAAAGGAAAAPDAGHAHGGAQVPAPPVAYTCPHHPRVMEAEPGECPSCGMALEPTTSAQTSPLRQRDDNPTLEAPGGEPEDAAEEHEHGGNG